MSSHTLLEAQAPLLAHSAPLDMGFQFGVFPCYLPEDRLGRKHSQLVHAFPRCRSLCAATPPDWCWLLAVSSTAWSDQTEGCKGRGQCLATSQKWFCSVSLTCPAVYALKTSCFFQILIQTLFQFLLLFLIIGGIKNACAFFLVLGAFFCLFWFFSNSPL